MIDTLHFDGWVRPVPGGLQLTLRLTPKAPRDDLDGVERGADGRAYLKARVRAVPEKGNANRALIALLAKRSGIAKSRFTLVSGETSRLKTLMVEGEDLTVEDAVAGLIKQDDSVSK